MSEKIKSFRDLNIWKNGIKIVELIYSITEYFPKNEIYGLISQMRRASVSIPSNIAEGFNRLHNKEYKQFLFIALGSCAELETHIELSNRLKFIDNAQKRNILEKIELEVKMIRALIAKVQQSVENYHKVSDVSFQILDTKY